MSVRITCLLLILSTTTVAQNDQQSRIETLVRQAVTTDKKDLDPKILAELDQSAAQLREQHINAISDRLKLTKEQLAQAQPMVSINSFSPRTSRVMVSSIIRLLAARDSRSKNAAEAEMTR